MSRQVVLTRLCALPDRRRPPADLKEAAEILFGTWRLAVQAAGFLDDETAKRARRALAPRAR